MVLPFLATLAKRARQVYPLVVRGVREGLSANSILESLQASGLGIRRQTLLDMSRRIRGVADAGSQLRFMRRNFIPDPRRIPEALTKMRRAFAFRVRVRGVQLETGEDLERFVTVSVNDPISRADAEAIAASMIADEPEFYKLAVTDVLMVDAVKAGVQGTLL